MLMYIVRRMTIAMFTLVVSSGVLFAGPLEDGLAAYGHRDYSTARQILLPLAEQGNARAQLTLGTLYYSGDGLRGFK